MQKIHKHLEKRGVPLASAQVQYSLLSKGPQQQEIKAVCRDLGVQMIAYSPLALGMLSGEAPHKVHLLERDLHAGAHGRCTWPVHIAGAHGRCTWLVHMAGAHGQGSVGLKCVVRRQRGPARTSTEPEICAQDTVALLCRTMLLRCCCCAESHIWLSLLLQSSMMVTRCMVCSTYACHRSAET